MRPFSREIATAFGLAMTAVGEADAGIDAAQWTIPDRRGHDPALRKAQNMLRVGSALSVSRERQRLLR